MAKELPGILERWRIYRAAVYGIGGSAAATGPPAAEAAEAEDGEATAAAGASTP
jgi:hypothetical protein